MTDLSSIILLCYSTHEKSVLAYNENFLHLRTAKLEKQNGSCHDSVQETRKFWPENWKNSSVQPFPVEAATSYWIINVRMFPNPM
jgi:hypothetical protein